MSLASNAYLGSLRLQAQQRADLENSPNISVPNWNQLISSSAKELYDLIVSAYGNDYSIQTPYQFTIDATMLYPLPSDFYKLLLVEMQYSASPTGWVTLQNFELLEKNKYSWLTPTPITASLIQLTYVPEPTPLQFVEICSTIAGSTTMGVNNVNSLAVGMSVYGPGIPAASPLYGFTTITGVNTSLNQVTLSAPANLTQSGVPLQCWTDTATFDGISGWEEYVIIDAARKAGIPQETDISQLNADKAEMKQRIIDMAEGRNLAQAAHSVDALSLNTSIISIGATSLKYRLFGNQIMFTPAGYDSFGDSLGMGGY